MSCKESLVPMATATTQHFSSQPLISVLKVELVISERTKAKRTWMQTRRCCTYACMSRNYGTIVSQCLIKV